MGSLVIILSCQIAQEMAHTCKAVIKDEYPDTTIGIEVLKEPREASFGNGTGIM